MEFVNLWNRKKREIKTGISLVFSLGVITKNSLPKHFPCFLPGILWFPVLHLKYPFDLIFMSGVR